MVEVVVLMLTRGVRGGEVGVDGWVRSKPVSLSKSQKEEGEPIMALRWGMVGGHLGGGMGIVLLQWEFRDGKQSPGRVKRRPDP